MCAQYTLNTRVQKLGQFFGIKVEKDQDIQLRVLPYTPGLVIRKINDQIKFEKMNYSLVPSWSKQSRVKFASYNARLETILEKPTWKVPFMSKRCLVPMSSFIEAIYTHELAGNMVQFSEVENKFLTAAGLWDAWIDPQTKQEIHSFAIITDEPPPSILKAGHDRCPIFLKEATFSDWLDGRCTDPKSLFDLLKSQKEEIHFKTEIDRPLKVGWQKRHQEPL